MSKTLVDMRVGPCLCSVFPAKVTRGQQKVLVELTCFVALSFLQICNLIQVVRCWKKINDCTDL